MKKHTCALTLALAAAACGSEPTKNMMQPSSLDAALSSKPDGNGFLTRQGTKFYLDGAEYKAVGVNRYELAGGPSVRDCRHDSKADAFREYQEDFIKVAADNGATLIRLWAFQNFAGPEGNDFSYLDQAVRYAKKYNVRLILTLENNWADCTFPRGEPKDAGWFTNGYKSPYGYRLSLPDYVRLIVNHFKDEPTIAMWQVINEGKWYQDPSVLANFTHEIASLIKSIDKNHLVSGGGAIQCWQGQTGGRDFQQFHQSEYVDVLDAHDYEDERSAWPSCMQYALEASQNLNKPFIIGEAGMSIDSGFDVNLRAQLIDAKMRAAADKGTRAYLIWSLNTKANYHDGFDVFPGDATLSALQSAARDTYPAPKPTTPAPTPTPTPTPTAPAPTPTPTPTVPAPTPAPTPTPTAPAPSGNCEVSLQQPSNVWQTAPNQWGAVLNIDVKNMGGSGVPAPWRFDIDVEGLKGLGSPWNWEATAQSDGHVTGTVTASWAALQPHGGNTVSVGGIATLSVSQLKLSRATVNGQSCTIR